MPKSKAGYNSAIQQSKLIKSTSYVLTIQQESQNHEKP